MDSREEEEQKYPRYFLSRLEPNDLDRNAKERKMGEVIRLQGRQFMDIYPPPPCSLKVPEGIVLVCRFKRVSIKLHDDDGIGFYWPGTVCDVSSAGVKVTSVCSYRSRHDFPDASKGRKAAFERALKFMRAGRDFRTKAWFHYHEFEKTHGDKKNLSFWLDVGDVRGSVCEDVVKI